jgi:translocation and assembly module TamA
MLLSLALALLLPPAAPRAADPQPYTVNLAQTGEAGLDAALAGSSQLIGLSKTAPVGPFALIARAEADAGRFRTALDSFGYYDGQARITIAGRPLDDPALPDLLDRAPADPPVEVAVTFDKGAQYHLGTVRIDGGVPEAARDSLKLTPGQPARASDVLAARDRLLAALQGEGYALARVAEPVAVLRPPEHALDVSFPVQAGPRVDLGPIALNGLVRMNPGFVRERLLVHQGEQYDPAAIEKARQDLASLGPFASVRVVPADHVDTDGQLPLAFDFTERKRHAVTLGGAYSTDLGAGVTATWSDRNVFGNAEQLNLTTGFQLGGTAQRAPGYNANLQFIKPDFLARDQQLEANLGAIKQSLQAYDQTAVLADTSISRPLAEHLRGSIGIAFEQEQIEQQGVTRNYTLLGVPLTLRYDSTDSLFQPTKGVRALAAVTPTESLRAPSATFVLMQLSGSTYFDFSRVGFAEPGRSILAVRGLVGSAQGASQFELPPDKRFYAGGTATVRGYRYQSVGPTFPGTTTPEGGTAIAAGTIELRQRIWENWGAAFFVDAGQVTADGAPFAGTWRIGAGVGARYYTSIGPIRADIAVPVNPPHGADSLEIYIGIGEAF